jgi:ribosomal protein S18 acetylase RimI-like enzyme
MATTDEELREAASHRGLKLVKSRRRKSGTGDYGLFGLTDGAGKALFGIDEEGLTATGEQIADFLRKAEASTWSESARITPARPKAVSPVSTAHDAEDDLPPAVRPRRRTSARMSAGRQRPQPDEPAERAVVENPRSEKPAAKARPVPEPEQPEPELTIRTARPADADALRTLFAASGSDGAIAEIKRAIAAAKSRKEPILVADRGGVVGCIAFHMIPTIQHGPIARITTLTVAEDERRRGVGRALYDAALSEFTKQKIRCVEAMSDIEVRNANGFYRALGLKQASYRFVTEL